MIMKKMLARCCTFTAIAVLCVAAEAPGFKVTKKYPVPGNGGFDYIVFDSSSNRLYVSHGTEVNVLDADSGKVLGKVEDTPGVHGIAIVPNLHRGFTTNGGNATISVFDTETFKTLKTISVAKDPDFTFYDPHTKRVLVCHGDAAAITAIDPEKTGCHRQDRFGRWCGSGGPKWKGDGLCESRGRSNCGQLRSAAPVPVRNLALARRAANSPKVVAHRAEMSAN
jgi:hypothetical protein